MAGSQVKTHVTVPKWFESFESGNRNFTPGVENFPYQGIQYLGLTTGYPIHDNAVNLYRSIVSSRVTYLLGLLLFL